MTIMSKRGNLDNVVTYEHICDTTADMANIDPKYITLGSSCIVIVGDSGEMEVYLADSDKNWNFVESTGTGGGGGSGDGSGTPGVTSFKGRRGNVMPQKGDYSADKIPTSWAGKTVQDKLDELEEQQRLDTTLSSGSVKGVQNWVINQAVDELTAKSLPRGGNSGAILTKHSSADFDAEWTSENVFMKKSTYDIDENGKVDRADAADSVQGPGSYKARLKNTGADTYLVTDVDKGVANGVVPLDSTGKILPQYLPDNLMNGLSNGGIFNATTRVITLSETAKSILGVTTNTITLENTGTVPTGYPTDAELYYITTVSGTFAGMNFSQGDWLISLGNKWQQLVNGNQVSSVQGKTGAVLLSSDDVTEGVVNLYMTSAEKTKLRDIEAEATKDIDVIQSASIVYPASGKRVLRLENKNGTVTDFEGNEIDETQFLKKNGDASDTTVTYGTAASRIAMPGTGTMRDTIALIRRYLSDLQTVAFTGSYADLVDEPTNLSQFTNDGNGDVSGPFITRDVSNLLNYYTKADSYTRREIDNLLAALEGHNYIVVERLPSSNIDTAAIYYVPIMDGDTQVGYDRYQRIGNQWAFLGSTDIDMNQYLKIDGDGTNITSTHTMPSSRLALTSGEKLSVSLGKIAKWLSDIRTVAFTGSFNDLSDTDDIVHDDDLEDYVQKDQGITNAGKVMGVGVDGKVAPVAASEGATRRGSGAYAVIGNDDSETPINRAEGAYSTAFGDHTVAKGAGKFVAGKFNWIDNNNLYAEQIGGGDENTRLDLRNTDWSGKGYYRNGVSVGNTTDNIVEPENGNDLTTKTYVDRTIGEEIAKADLLRSMVVAEVPTLALADNNTLYLVPDPTSENHYQQYKKVLKSQNPDVYEMANLGGTQLTLESNQVEFFPQASATYVDKVYQYVGANSGDYIKGANYTCTVRPFYAWLRVGDADHIYFTEHAPVVAREYVYRGSSGYVGSICALTASGNSTTFTDGLGNTYTRLASEDLSNYYQWTPLLTKLSDFTNDLKVSAFENNGTGSGAKNDYFISKKDLLDLVYPVGSIYITMSLTSPETLFGGTWTRIEDRFLLACGATHNVVNSFGGSETTTIKRSDLPNVNITTSSAGKKTVNLDGVKGYGYKQGGASNKWGMDYGTHELYEAKSYGSSEETASNHTHSVSLNGGVTQTNLDNMPPYVTVIVWRRTA